MRRIYRMALIALMIVLVGCGAWYVYSCYNEQSSYKDAILVWQREGGTECGAGNGIR